MTLSVDAWLLFGGLALQTVAMLAGALILHGRAMREIGQVEVKLDALWQEFLGRRA